MEYIGIIYLWLCTETNRVYIGLSRSSSVEQIRARINTPEKIFENRWRGHIQEAIHRPKDYFHYAIRKYDPDQFQGRILEIFRAATLEEITLLVNDAEQKYIKEYNSLAPNGYNLQSGGFSSTFHQSSKDKMTAKKQAFLNSPAGKEWIQKCSEAQLLHFQTERGVEQAKTHGEYIKSLYEERPEIKASISKKLVEFFKTKEGQEQIEKQKQFMKDYYESEEGSLARENLREHALKRWEGPGYREKQIELGKERFSGEEGVKRRDDLSAKAIERNKDPERRKAASAKTTAYFDTIGRKEYTCDICDGKQFRDKTAYTKHCESKTHAKRVAGTTSSSDESAETILGIGAGAGAGAGAAFARIVEYRAKMKPELLALCKQKDISGYSGKTKEQLIALLMKAL